MPAQVPFCDLSEGWRESGEDLHPFLELGVRSLREQPTPDVSGRLGPAGGPEADITVRDDVLDPDNQAIRVLREVLDAQYGWTATVFGICP